MLNAALSSSLMLKPGPEMGAYALMPRKSSLLVIRLRTASASDTSEVAPLLKMPKKKAEGAAARERLRPVKLMPAREGGGTGGGKAVQPAGGFSAPAGRQRAHCPQDCRRTDYCMRRGGEGSGPRPSEPPLTNADEREGRVAQDGLDLVHQRTPVGGVLGNRAAHLALRARVRGCAVMRNRLAWKGADAPRPGGGLRAAAARGLIAVLQADAGTQTRRCHARNRRRPLPAAPGRGAARGGA
jgi:hypothetical protein